MGRYYSGDIEGKFMFAVQSSQSGERFGAVEEESGYTPYIVHRENYSEIQQELDDIVSTGSVKKVDDFFDELSKNGGRGYNDSDLEEAGILKDDMSQWADHRLGKQIKDWFDNNPDEDELRFEAEL
tara:strand:- start:3910 stop:4287 length:378 start_codon:yes stop_codon:yes gene_type:complete